MSTGSACLGVRQEGNHICAHGIPGCRVYNPLEDLFTDPQYGKSKTIGKTLAAWIIPCRRCHIDPTHHPDLHQRFRIAIDPWNFQCAANGHWPDFSITECQLAIVPQRFSVDLDHFGCWGRVLGCHLVHSRKFDRCPGSKKGKSKP